MALTEEEAARRKKTNIRTFKIFGVFMVLLVAIVVLGENAEKQTSGNEPAGNDNPENTQIKKLSNKVSNVEIIDIEGKEKNGVIRVANIDLNFESVWSEESYLLSAGSEAMAISEKIVKKFPSEYTSLRFSFFAPTVDKYGNSTQENMFSILINMETLKKINWGNLLYQRFLNLTHLHDVTPIGRRIVYKWCEDGNREYARDFCSGD